MFLKEKLLQAKNSMADHKKDAVFIFLIFLMSSLSFGLGYLVNREFNRAPIIIEKCSDFIVNNEQ